MKCFSYRVCDNSWQNIHRWFNEYNDFVLTVLDSWNLRKQFCKIQWISLPWRAHQGRCKNGPNYLGTTILHQHQQNGPWPAQAYCLSDTWSPSTKRSVIMLNKVKGFKATDSWRGRALVSFYSKRKVAGLCLSQRMLGVCGEREHAQQYRAKGTF